MLFAVDECWRRLSRWWFVDSFDSLERRLMVCDNDLNQRALLNVFSPLRLSDP